MLRTKCWKLNRRLLLGFCSPLKIRLPRFSLCTLVLDASPVWLAASSITLSSWTTKWSMEGIAQCAPMFLDSMRGHYELVQLCRGELHAPLVSIDHPSRHIDTDRFLVLDEDHILDLEAEVQLAILELPDQSALELKLVPSVSHRWDVELLVALASLEAELWSMEVLDHLHSQLGQLHHLLLR